MSEHQRVTESGAKHIEARARNQAKSKEWFAERSWHVTASRFRDVCKTTLRRDKQKLMFVYAKLKGSSVPWPVEVLTIEDESVTVYVKSDNAELTVKRADVQPFRVEPELWCQSTDKLVQKKLFSTLECYQKDLDWAAAGYQDDLQDNAGEKECQNSEVDNGQICGEESKDLRKEEGPGLLNEGILDTGEDSHDSRDKGGQDIGYKNVGNEGQDCRDGKVQDFRDKKAQDSKEGNQDSGDSKGQDSTDGKSQELEYDNHHESLDNYNETSRNKGQDSGKGQDSQDEDQNLGEGKSQDSGAVDQDSRHDLQQNCEEKDNVRNERQDCRDGKVQDFRDNEAQDSKEGNQDSGDEGHESSENDNGQNSGDSKGQYSTDGKSQELGYDNHHESLDNDIPDPKDIGELVTHIKEELKADPQLKDFRTIATYVQARLLIYNKRRSGEIDAVSLKNYAARQTELKDIDRSLIGDLTKLEEHLLMSQQLMMVRGKRSRPVPVLLPNDTYKALAYLADPKVRRSAGIKEDNKYLFATTGQGTLRSYDSVRAVCEKLGLKSPERITSVNLRKYTATLSQVLDLDQNQMDWLCNHLGHTKQVHKDHYRQMSGFLERTEVAKVFLIQDLGLAGKFVGKKTSDLTAQDILEAATSPCIDVPADPPASNVWEFSTDDEDGSGPPHKRPKPATRVKWTTVEMEEIQKYFERFLQTKTTPGQKDCHKVIKISRAKGGQLHRRSPPLIIKKISYLNKK